MTAGPEELDPVQPIRTERLLLRPFTPDELEAVAGGVHLAHFAPGFPPLPDRDWAREALEAGSHFYTETRFARLAVVDRSSGCVIGTAGFAGPPIDAELELMASIVTDRQNQGLASEALPELMRFAFEDPAVVAVHASIPPGNEAAEKLLLDHGFVPRGTLGGTEASYVYPRH